MLKILLFALFASALYAVSPASQIILVNNFISTDVANTLMEYYDAKKQNLNTNSDNECSLSSIDNSHVKKIILDLSEQVIQLIYRSYPSMGNKYQLDHAGLYARIPKNHCGYHADNVYFYCPIHGRDQQQLRTTCPGDCPGSEFVPNHTSWRKYTALIYLNDEFEGGEITFEDGPHNVLYKKTIPIEANLLVLSPNGSDFYHEVFPIRKGKRYSLHLWFKPAN